MNVSCIWRYERFNSDRAFYYLYRTYTAVTINCLFLTNTLLSIYNITHPSSKWWICCIRIVKTAIMPSYMCTKENHDCAVLLLLLLLLHTVEYHGFLISRAWAIKRIRRSSKWACFTIICQGCSRNVVCYVLRYDVTTAVFIKHCLFFGSNYFAFFNFYYYRCLWHIRFIQFNFFLIKWIQICRN